MSTSLLTGARDRRDQRSFLLQRAQPAMNGLIDGSLSTLAPIFAIAFATSAALGRGRLTAAGCPASQRPRPVMEYRAE